MAADALRRGSTIRARTTGAACVVVTFALAVGAVLVVVVLRRSLVDNVQAAASARAEDVASLVRQGNLPSRLAAPGEEDSLVQVVDSQGRVVAASANLEGEDPIVAFEGIGPSDRTQTVGRLPIGEEQDFVLVAVRATRGASDFTIYAAGSLEQVEESVAVVQGILVVGLPMLLALVGFTTWVIVGRALDPVDAIREEVADISSNDLSRRVPEPATDDEIGRLARTMNAMLERLETFTDRQRRFVADASHELQSPIASTRAELEVALAHPELADWATTAAELLDDNHRMERLVRDLLFLARTESAAPVAAGPVDLDDLTRTEVERVRLRTPITIDTSGIFAVEVYGNSDQLARVIRNLLENATRHASTTVAVHLTLNDGDARLVVSDDGPGIAADDRERVFERFTRLDASRNRGTGGAGLGLAIAREIVAAHRGSIAVIDSNVGASFAVELPAR